MHRCFFHIPTIALILATASTIGMAQTPSVTARFHAWGRFDPGSWKTIRLFSDTLNERGQVVGASTTDVTTTLLDIDNAGIALEVQTCMEVAGKRFESEPQTLKQGFHGELFAPNVKQTEPINGFVMIEDQKIPCLVQQFESNGASGKTATSVYYSPTVAPYVLKRETVTTSPEGKADGGETRTVFEVLSLNMPRRILGETRNGAYTRTVHQNAKGVVTTLGFVVPEVPGGVVDQSTKEVDKNGRLVRRSTLTLVEYNADPIKDRDELPRKRPRRERAKSSGR